MTDIPPSAISDSPPEPKPKPPKGGGGPDPFSDPDLSLKLGCIGRIIGHGEEKKGNIAFVIAIMAFLLLIACGVGWVSTNDPDARSFLGSAITPIFGLLTGVIGFIQGRKE